MKKIIFKYILNLSLVIYSFCLFITNIGYSNKTIVFVIFLAFLYFLIKFIILNLFIISKKMIWKKIDIFINLILYFGFVGYGIYLLKYSSSDYFYIGITLILGFLVMIFYNIYKLYKNKFTINILNNFQKNEFIKYNLIIIGIISVLLFFYTRHKVYEIPKNYFPKINYSEERKDIEKMKYFDETKYGKIRNKIDYDDLYGSIEKLNDEDITYLEYLYISTKGEFGIDDYINYNYNNLVSLSRCYKLLANYYYQNNQKNKTIEIYKDLSLKSIELQNSYNNFIKIVIFESIQKGIIKELEQNNFDENTTKKIISNIENFDTKEVFKRGLTLEYYSGMYYLDNIFMNIPLLFDKKIIRNYLAYKYYYPIENNGKDFSLKNIYFKSNILGSFLINSGYDIFEETYKELQEIELKIKELKTSF